MRKRQKFSKLNTQGRGTNNVNSNSNLRKTQYQSLTKAGTKRNSQATDHDSVSKILTPHNHDTSYLPISHYLAEKKNVSARA